MYTFPFACSRSLVKGFQRPPARAARISLSSFLMASSMSFRSGPPSMVTALTGGAEAGLPLMRLRVSHWEATMPRLK